MICPACLQKQFGFLLCYEEITLNGHLKKAAVELERLKKE
jgi:hypothetical protein